MPVKSGKARILTKKDQAHLFKVIQHHRHPEKNTAIMQVSLKLGLKAQEIAHLKIKEIAEISIDGLSFVLREELELQSIKTKAIDTPNRSKPIYKRRVVTFTLDEFHRTVHTIEQLVKAGKPVNAEDFYPHIRTLTGTSRCLPVYDTDLREALKSYLEHRISTTGALRPNDPLFQSQKGGAYSPNTLQEHMALMLRVWAGIKKASSHSGRRTVLSNMLNTRGSTTTSTQQFAGHSCPSSTIKYDN